MRTAVARSVVALCRVPGIVTLSCTWAWVCVPLSAQEPSPPPQPLVLDPNGAAALALKNSAQLRIDAQSVAQAEAQLREILALDNVQLNLATNLVRRGPQPSLPPGFESFYIKTIHSESLTASKILWTWGKLESQRDLAQAGVETAQAAPAVTRLALAKLAREALIELVYDERLLDVDHETLASLTEHQRVTEKRYREGLIAFFEVAQAEAQVARAQSLIADRRSLIERDRVALRRVLAVDQTTPLAVSVNNMPEPPTTGLKENIEYALENRPEMKQAQTAVRLQEASIRVAQTSLRPTVSVSAQVQDQTASFSMKPITYQIVVALQKPILDGGATKAKIKGAQAGLEAARQRVELVAQAVGAEVADKYVQIDRLKERIAAAEMAERSAREQLRIARLRFDEDVGLGAEVIDAQAAVATAQTDRAEGELELNLVLVGLRAAMGMLDLQEAP
ncbi:MAG: TolC family protein [Armatimonadetes bacterium]|nr:TolC family protein [Armatimonadota bacterium]